MPSTLPQRNGKCQLFTWKGAMAGSLHNEQEGLRQLSAQRRRLANLYSGQLAEGGTHDFTQRSCWMRVDHASSLRPIPARNTSEHFHSYSLSDLFDAGDTRFESLEPSGFRLLPSRFRLLHGFALGCRSGWWRWVRLFILFFFTVLLPGSVCNT